jgi:uncharacterized protein (TIGR00730 family)
MRVCVFAGSSIGRRPAYLAAARQLGRVLAEQDAGLVYGGASVGAMGALADAVLAAGGRVTGVIPRSLVEREIAHKGIDDLRVVETMHERKALMAELADAFVALPGGAGTLEELFEVWTWAQLGLHAKPCGLLDVEGYYRPLRAMVEHMTAEEFLRPQYRDMLLFEAEPRALLDGFATYRPPARKWELPLNGARTAGD